MTPFSTVIILAITSTLKFGELPGNVVLNKGEANLPRRCVVNITQIISVDKRAALRKKSVRYPKSGCRKSIMD
jgi:mRNA interferase MazF